MGQLARQFANGFRDILLGVKGKDIGKNDLDAPIDFGEVNPLFKTTVSSEGEDRLIKEGQILDPYTAEDRMRYPIAEGFPVKDEYNFDSNFEPRFYSGSKSEIQTKEEVFSESTGDITYDFQRFEPEADNPYFKPVVNNPRTGPRGDDLTIRRSETAIPESASTELMPFYSTIESSLRSLNIKNTGMLGKQIKQKLNKVKNYNEEEAAFIGFNLDDNTTYTNKDLNKLLEDKGIIVTANIKTKSDTLNRLKKENASVNTIYDKDKDWSYSQTQRQNIKNVINDEDLAQKYPDNPSDSFELSINVNPVFVKGSDTYEGRANFIDKNIGLTHSINKEAGPTLAHARGDVYTTHDGIKEILMSEFQTDAMRDLKGPNALGYNNRPKKPNYSDEYFEKEAHSVREGEILSDALMLSNFNKRNKAESALDALDRNYAEQSRRGRISPEEQAELDTRTSFMVKQPYYGEYSDLTPSEVLFLRNESPKDAVKIEYLYLSEQNWMNEIGLKGPYGNTRSDRGFELIDQANDSISGQFMLVDKPDLRDEQLDTINNFLYKTTPKFAKDIKYKDGSIFAYKGDAVSTKQLDKIVDEELTKNIEISFFEFDKNTSFNMSKDFPFKYLLKAADPKYKHTRKIKTISLEPIKGQKQGPLDKRQLLKNVKVKNPGFVERKLPIPTGRYSAPERYLEKLLQSIIVYAKREGIDTIRIPAPFDIGKERGIDFLKGSVLKDNYIISMDRALKNITTEEPKIKVKRTQRENPYKGRREDWENDQEVEVDFADILLDDEGPLDEDFIPNVENADDLAGAGIFQDADRETVDLATGNVTRIGQYKPGPEEEIWDASKPRFKEIITIDIKGLKLDNIEGLKGRYAKGGLVTAPNNGLMSR
jgi:hypothetical protein